MPLHGHPGSPTPPCLPQALLVHRTNGEEFGPIADLLTTAAHAALLRLPLESDLVLAVADLLAALSKVRLAGPFASPLASPLVSPLASPLASPLGSP